MMRRTSTMTWGFILILIGLQLNLVQSYELTPRFSTFISENSNVSAPVTVAPANQPYNSPYYQASYPNPASNLPAPNPEAGKLKTIDVPNWLCWPVLFLGAVLFLHGLAKQN